MKQSMSPTLIAWLLANKNCSKADLFILNLPTGDTMYMTESPLDITIPSGTSGWSGSTTTFSSTLWGRWSRGAITSEASFDLSANTMDLTCVPQPSTVYPNTTANILAAAFYGLFDGATIAVYTAYFPINQWGTLAPGGIETKFANGIISPIKDLDRVHIKFEVHDVFYLLDQKVPGRLFQPDCTLDFCGSVCGLNAANYTVAFTQSSASTVSGTVLTPTSAFTQSAGYFTQGTVKCTGGANNGLAKNVQLHASGVLTVDTPWLLPVSAGDTFSVIAGCDHTMAGCSSRKWTNGTTEPQNWELRFPGTPFTPVPTTV